MGKKPKKKAKKSKAVKRPPKVTLEDIKNGLVNILARLQRMENRIITLEKRSSVVEPSAADVDTAARDAA